MKEKNWSLIGSIGLFSCAIANFSMYICSFFYGIMNSGNYSNKIEFIVGLLNNIYTILSVGGAVAVLLFIFTKLKRGGGNSVSLNIGAAAALLIIVYVIILRVNNLFIGIRNLEHIFEFILCFFFDLINILFSVLVVLLAFSITKNVRANFTVVIFKIVALVQCISGSFGVIILNFYGWEYDYIMNIIAMRFMRVHWLMLAISLAFFVVIIKSKKYMTRNLDNQKWFMNDNDELSLKKYEVIKMITCKNCNESLQADSRFCNYCGEAVKKH